MGAYWVDSTMTRRLGMPPAAYSRLHPMSDRLQAILMNPWFLVVDPMVKLSQIVVPWALKGLLLFNLTVALPLAAALHKSMSLLDRCEIALTGLVLLDLWRLVAEKTAREMQVSPSSLCMALQTSKNLQSLAMSIAAITASKDEALAILSTFWL